MTTWTTDDLIEYFDNFAFDAIPAGAPLDRCRHPARAVDRYPRPLNALSVINEQTTDRTKAEDHE